MSIKIRFGLKEDQTQFDNEAEAIDRIILRRKVKAIVEQSDGQRISAVSFLNAHLEQLVEPRRSAALRFIALAKCVANYAADADIVWSGSEQDNLTWRVVEKLATEDKYEKQEFTATCAGIALTTFSTPEILSAIIREQSPAPTLPPQPVKSAKKIIMSRIKRSVKVKFVVVAAVSLFLSLLFPLLFLFLFIEVVVFFILYLVPSLIPGIQTCFCSNCETEVDYEDTSCHHCSRVFDGKERDRPSSD